MYIDYLISSIGIIRIQANTKAINSISFVETVGMNIHSNSLIQTCKTQLSEYLNGQRTLFSVPVSIEGTPFQKEVWNALIDIPYGNTYSYQEIALAIKKPTALRAVGTAIGKNPLAIIIPCHRVLPKQGGIGNYHWGKSIKETLLNLEKLHNNQ